jgi:hypothetical protein
MARALVLLVLLGLMMGLAHGLNVIEGSRGPSKFATKLGQRGQHHVELR